jgi:3-phosphoshikimate 1-carboxyvinyltransferase
MEVTVVPGARLQGEVAVPGDKSISHRAVMLAALAQGSRRESKFMFGTDT